jgi:hypothetical protein
VNTCSIEGCRRRCMAPYTECEKHRPKVKRVHTKSRASQLEAQRRKNRRRRLSGCAAIWEAA